MVDNLIEEVTAMETQNSIDIYEAFEAETLSF